jgi:hypothetical protein
MPGVKKNQNEGGKTMKVILPLAFVLILFPAPGFPQSSYRCNDRLVSVGDASGEVLSKCGDPSGRQVLSQGGQGFSESRVVRTERGSYVQQGSYEPIPAREKWTYNCGDGTEIHILIFEDGKLRTIKTEDRGTGPRRCN